MMDDLLNNCTDGRTKSEKRKEERKEKSALNLVGLAAAEGDGMNKGSLTVAGEARITNHVIPLFADLH